MQKEPMHIQVDSNASPSEPGGGGGAGGLAIAPADFSMNRSKTLSFKMPCIITYPLLWIF